MRQYTSMQRALRGRVPNVSGLCCWPFCHCHDGFGPRNVSPELAEEGKDAAEEEESARRTAGRQARATSKSYLLRLFDSRVNVAVKMQVIRRIQRVRVRQCSVHKCAAKGKRHPARHRCTTLPSQACATCANPQPLPEKACAPATLQVTSYSILQHAADSTEGEKAT